MLCLHFFKMCNGLKISKYKVYWLTDFPLINCWTHVKKENYDDLSLEAVYSYKKSK